MRLACQVLAAIVAAWCVWLVVASPPLTVSVRISEQTETFVVACDSPIGRGAGTDLDSVDGTVGESWEVTEDEGIYTAAVNSDDDTTGRGGIDDGAIDGACDGRRDRRLGWAVLGSLVVAGLLRAAVAFPARPVPTSRRRDPRRGSPLSPEV